MIEIYVIIFMFAFAGWFSVTCGIQSAKNIALYCKNKQPIRMGFNIMALILSPVIFVVVMGMALAVIQMFYVTTTGQLI